MEKVGYFYTIHSTFPVLSLKNGQHFHVVEVMIRKKSTRRVLHQFCNKYTSAKFADSSDRMNSNNDVRNQQNWYQVTIQKKYITGR